MRANGRLALLGAFLACVCCARSERPALVFAAASLTAPFASIAEAFTKQHPGRPIDLHFAGTPHLVVQLREGAAADVFASADMPNMERVTAIAKPRKPPQLFARNRLTIITASGNPKGIRGLADLGRADLRVLLCGPEVPAGRYAREALAKAKVTVRTVSDEPSVKAVVSKVRLGEVDAGIVYVTDAASAGAELATVAIPDEHNVIASYPIAALSGGKHPETADAFVAFALSEEGQRILQTFGFATP